MNKMVMKNGCLIIALMTILLVTLPSTTGAVVDGITGTTFNLTAKAGTISMGDGSVGVQEQEDAGLPDSPLLPCSPAPLLLRPDHALSYSFVSTNSLWRSASAAVRRPRMVCSSTSIALSAA